MYTITKVHLDFFRALQLSRPDTQAQAHIRVPHMQCVRVCVHAHTQRIHINPLSKFGRHCPCPNESLTLETNVNSRPAGKTSLIPLLHMHTIVFRTPVNSAENTCRAYIRKEKITTTKWIIMMTETTSTKMKREDGHHKMNWNDDSDDKHDDNGAQKTDANLHGPALLPSICSNQARQAPPNPPPHNLPPSFPTQEQLMVIFCCPTSWSCSPSRQQIRYPHR